jgi:hypothetical protein
MGAAEHIAYDPIQVYMYIQSEEGPCVNVLDYASLPPKLTTFSLDLKAYKPEITDLGICPEQGLLFIVLPDSDKVNMYTTVKRSDPETAPELLFEIDAAPCRTIFASTKPVPSWQSPTGKAGIFFGGAHGVPYRFGSLNARLQSRPRIAFSSAQATLAQPMQLMATKTMTVSREVPLLVL